MYTMNQLTLIGFTGQDAEVHYTQNGTLVTTLSIATKESWKNADGSWQSRSEWHRVVLFGPLAEYARTLTKGSLVLVQVPSAPVNTRRTASSTACSKFAPRPSASSTALSARK